MVAVPVHGKEFTSISCIAGSVRTGFALIFVLEYCALVGYGQVANQRIIYGGVVKWLTHKIFILALARSNRVTVTNEHYAPLAVRGSILE